MHSFSILASEEKRVNPLITTEKNKKEVARLWHYNTRIEYPIIIPAASSL